MTAAGGVHYLDEGTYEFFGSELSYNSGQSLISVKGDEAKPCLLNGVVVDEVVYNLKTGAAQPKGLHGSSVPIPQKHK